MFELTAVVAFLSFPLMAMLSGMYLLKKRREKTEDHVHAIATAGRVAVGMAHDLNNLLSTIMGKAELIREGPYKSQAKSASDEIVKLCESAARMTHYVMTLVQPKVIDVRETDAASHIRELKTVLKAISGRTTHLLIHVAPMSVNVRIPPSDIDQLLVNLVLNAREAGAANIRIDVTTTAKSGGEKWWLNIVVADDGPGMSEFVLAEATKELFSGRSTGTGIGLNTVKRIVEKSEGFLELKNNVGGGLQVSVALPCACPSFANSA